MSTRSGNFSAIPANRGSSTGCARSVLWAVAVKDEELAGINLISERLQKTREGMPGGIAVSKECKNLIFEFQRYHAPERNPNKPYRDRPLAVHNYALDALRFLVLGLSYEAIPKVRWL